MVSVYKSDKAVEAMNRRDELRDLGVCINGAKHAAPVEGRDRCAWCIAVHRLGVRTAYHNACVDKEAPQPPAGYVYRTRRTY